MTTDRNRLVAPLVGTGVLMALYLLLRPYGDHGDPAEALDAFASTAWVVSHVCGALALVAVGRLALRVSDVVGGWRGRATRLSGLAGAVLVLPYYGAETFALHEIARDQVLRQRLSDGDAMTLVESIRANAVAMTLFGLGLALLAVAAVLVAVIWQRGSEARDTGAAIGQTTRPWRWAGWPLAIAVVLVLPQYVLPPALRMTFGVLYALAAGLFLLAVLRAGASDAALHDESQLAASR